MKILGLDLATKTGWSFTEDGVYKESGVADFSKKRGEDNGILFLKFRKWLIETCLKKEIDVIAYERAHFRGGASTEIGVGLQTHVQSLATEYHKQVYPLHTATIKKKATGNGRAGKQDMIKRACELSGKNITSDDEADAVLISLLAHEDLNPVLDL